MASGSITGGGTSKTKVKRSESGNKIQKRSKPTMVRPIPFGSEDNHQMMKISLSSISKLEVRNLKRKLQAELDEVRSLIKRHGPQGNFADDFGPPVSNKKLKTANGGKKSGVHGAGTGDNKATVQIMKNCNNLLSRLMKHKSGWVFNTPVDAVRFGLHDYHSIVKNPMDLGTVKTRLSQSWYKSPLEFAEDVRLTFNNAMLYNPVGHDVHRMAETLLNLFEEKWAPLQTQYELLNKRQQPVRDIDFDAPVSSNNITVEPLPLPAPTPSLSQPPPKVVENRTLERAESMTNPVESAVLSVVPEKPGEKEASGNRDLTYEEKRRLNEDLQDLPDDKLEAVVQIIKKSNPELTQQDDEIELDIDSLHLETLWELYRFVTEYKESLNKKNEEQALGSERDAESVVQEQNTQATSLKSPKATELGHVTSPVRQEVNASGSSSSSSSGSGSGSGSCSSDSDSDS